MIITTAQYTYDGGEVSGIVANIDGEEVAVPVWEGNRHYDEIMRQVNAGTLTIQEAQ